MKKTSLFLLTILLAFACSKKNTPTKTEVKENIPVELAPSETYLAGKTTYATKCGKCHELFSPQKGNIDFWNIWVNKMAPKAKLTETEKNNVLAYLATDCLK